MEKTKLMVMFVFSLFLVSVFAVSVVGTHNQGKTHCDDCRSVTSCTSQCLDAGIVDRDECGPICQKANDQCKATCDSSPPPLPFCERPENKNSISCDPNFCEKNPGSLFCERIYPEFSTLGVGLASIGGLAGYSLYRRKKKQI
jgi:hypothetical protein